MPLNEKVRFSGADGENLVGQLHRPVGRARAYALFAHCFTCSKDIKAAVVVSRALAEKGIATLRFDFTGLGESPGDFADTNFSSNLDDLVAAAEFLKNTYEAPKILIGHSLGGAAVLAAAHRISSSVAVATLAAPCDPQHVAKLVQSKEEEIRSSGKAEVKLAGRTFTIKKQFLDDLSEQSQKKRIGEMRKALLVMHSPTDELVGIDNARMIYEAAKHPKSFVTLDGADHLLMKPADAEYAATVLSAWSERYLPELPEPTLEKGEVQVLGGPSGLTNRIDASGHWLWADEPKSMGGAELGPTPYDYLLAGLGACTSMTLRLYANRKGLKLDEVSVKLKHNRVHAKDCEDCETSSGQIAEIERTLSLEGDLDDEQRERLLEIADKCPVHKTLEGEVKVRTKLSPPAS